MKLTGRRIDGFLREALPDGILAVLVYGPDTGLVSERAALLAAKVVEDPRDPFRVAALTGDQVRSTPALLAEEALALSLDGGRRLVHVKDAGEDCAAPLKNLLDRPVPPEALIVVEAGGLGPRSPLRKLAEDRRNAAALPCYTDNANQIRGLIRERLDASNIKIDRDAENFVASHLGADRLQTRQEIEKLALYAGEGGRIALEDAAACIGDSVQLSLEDIAFATGGGDVVNLVAALDRAGAENQSPVSILRAVGRHFMRLDRAGTMTGRGESVDSAMKKLQPPVFFMREEAFARQLACWRRPRIAIALDRLNQAEIDCKTTGMPDRVIAERVLLNMSRAAAGWISPRR